MCCRQLIIPVVSFPRLTCIVQTRGSRLERPSEILTQREIVGLVGVKLGKNARSLRGQRCLRLHLTRSQLNFVVPRPMGVLSAVLIGRLGNDSSLG